MWPKSTNTNSVNGLRQIKRTRTNPWMCHLLGPKVQSLHRPPESRTEEGFSAEYKQCRYCCRLTDEVICRNTVYWHRCEWYWTNGSGGVQFRATEVGSRRVNCGNRNGPLVTHNSTVCSTQWVCSWMQCAVTLTLTLPKQVPARV